MQITMEMVEQEEEKVKEEIKGREGEKEEEPHPLTADRVP